jgi:hypothetical protein
MAGEVTPIKPAAYADARANDGGFLKRMSGLLQRAGFAGLLGQAFGGLRDYYEVFGYDRVLDLQKMWDMYHRGGIAHRIIHAYPDAVWARPPQLYVQGQTEWNANWDKFVKLTGLWNAIKKADVLAGLGRFSIILVGSTGRMDAPFRRGSKITYLQPYSEINVAISEWERDPTSPRFGLPLFYTVYPNRTRNRVAASFETTAPVGASFRVHHSRIWHFAHGALESPVYGIPRFAPIWNYLTDLTKIVGSSAESYWMTAYQGLHINIDKEVEMDEEDANDLSDEADEYQHGLRRILRTRGVDVTQLGSKVADPKGAFDVVLTLISGTTGVPKRVLLGSEAGQLASSQDKGNWAERVEEERINHAEPNVILPVVSWLNEYGIMEIPVEEVQVLWPEAYRMSPLERGQTAAQTARTIANIAKGMEPITMDPGTPDQLDPETGQVTVPGIAPTLGEPLITRDEARRIIGLSTDQQALIERPD